MMLNIYIYIYISQTNLLYIMFLFYCGRKYQIKTQNIQSELCQLRKSFFSLKGRAKD